MKDLLTKQIFHDIIPISTKGNQMITAAQAKQFAKMFHQQMDTIQDQITVAACYGKHQIEIDNSILPNVLVVLANNGYTIDSEPYRYVISWHE